MIYPIEGYDKEIYVKPSVKNPNIIVGDFTYIADSEFESHVTNYYPWSRDKLILGKFCQIASGVEFVMNDANHQMNAATTFPFYTLQGWEMNAPDPSEMPFKGDTVIGNDVWIGQNAVILPGVHIGDGAIIGANSANALMMNLSDCCSNSSGGIKALKKSTILSQSLHAVICQRLKQN